LTAVPADVASIFWRLSQADNLAAIATASAAAAYVGLGLARLAAAPMVSAMALLHGVFEKPPGFNEQSRVDVIG